MIISITTNTKRSVKSVTGQTFVKTNKRQINNDNITLVSMLIGLFHFLQTCWDLQQACAEKIHVFCPNFLVCIKKEGVFWGEDFAKRIAKTRDSLAQQQEVIRNSLWYQTYCCSTSTWKQILWFCCWGWANPFCHSNISETKKKGQIFQFT